MVVCLVTCSTGQVSESAWQANKVADTRTPAEKRAAAKEALDEAEKLLHQVAGASAPIHQSDFSFISVTGDGKSVCRCMRRSLIPSWLHGPWQCVGARASCWKGGPEMFKAFGFETWTNLADQDKIGYIQKQHSKKMQHEDSQGGRGDYVFLILFRLLACPIQGWTMVDPKRIGTSWCHKESAPRAPDGCAGQIPPWLQQFLFKALAMEGRRSSKHKIDTTVSQNDHTEGERP